MSLLATVVNFNPFALEFGADRGIRWYGLAYLAGFVAAIALLKWFSRRNLLRLKPQQCTDFVILGAMFGVMAGGRIGYALFYEPSLFGFDNTLPFWRLLRVWDGGMSSHGGILGVMAVVFWYGWKHRIPAVHLGDNLVTVAPLGLAFGRLANFINGELYGRLGTVPWAMKFPASLPESATTRAFAENPQAALDAQARIAAIAAEAQAAGFTPLVADAANNPSADFINYPHIVETARDQPALTQILETYLPTRHPSQLYEMLAEGILLFLILFVVRIKGGPRLPYGVLTGLFFVLYAVGRITVEHFREPDAAHILGLTRGQFYSCFMILIGIGFWLWAARRGKDQALAAAPAAIAPEFSADPTSPSSR